MTEIKLLPPVALRAMVLCFFALCLGCLPAEAAESTKLLSARQEEDEQVPKDVLDSVYTLLELADQKTGVPSDEVLAPLVDFALNHAVDEITLPDHNRASGVMARDTIQAPLERVLDYAYNPQIPAYLAFPSAIRLSGWLPGSPFSQRTEPLSAELEDLKRPLTLRGREYEEITPDAFSGAYYRYEMDRLLVLAQQGDTTVFVSVARQDDLSEVGHKGVILDEDNWNYFYSGIEGLTKAGLSWMDTFLYGGWSVAVYVQRPDAMKRTEVLVFKWLRGGWACLNVIRAKHILSGCRRSTKALRAVLEAETLPAAQELAAKHQELNALSDQELARRTDNYALAMERQWASHPVMSKESFAQILTRGGYADVLSRDQRESALLLEYLKARLGQGALVSN